MNAQTKCIVMLPLLGADSVLMHREHRLAESFSKLGHEVYFVNRITNPFTGRIRAEEARDNVKVINVLGLPYLRGRIPFVYKINDIILPLQLSRALKKINKEKILYITNPDWGYIASRVKSDGDMVVYDISDDFVALAKNSSWKKMVSKYEEKTLTVADKFIVTSDILGKKIPKGKDYGLVSNGVDFAGFGKAKPYIKRGKYRALAGFIGGIYNWVDLDLVKQSAITFPDVEFILVGPTNQRLKLEKLKEIGNIEAIGAVSKDKITEYFASLDIGLVPFVSEKEYPRLASVDSNKIYQYMYFGYPIVATAFPQTRNLSSYISVADTKEEFIKNLGEALENVGKKDQKKIDFALANTWDDKAEQIIEFLDR